MGETTVYNCILKTFITNILEHITPNVLDSQSGHIVTQDRRHSLQRRDREFDICFHFMTNRDKSGVV